MGFDSIAKVFSSVSNKRQTQKYQSAWNEVVRENPALKNHKFVVIPGNGPGYAETYPYYESDNPVPGVNTIEVRDKTLTRDQLKSLLVGESLHVLGGIDPETGIPVDKNFRQFKDQFINSMTPNQLTFERMQYRSGNPSMGVNGRSFDQWFETSRADAYLRGNISPLTDAERSDWSQGLTPEQQSLTARAAQYLKGGAR